MHKKTINLFNFLSHFKIEEEQMDAAIQDYVKNYDLKDNVPINVLNRSSLDNDQFLDKHRQDVTSFFHKAVELETKLVLEDYVDNINFSIFSVDGNAVSSMSLDERNRILLEIKLKLNTCPFLSDSSFIVDVFENLIWVEWTMPMPIKTSGFSEEQITALAANILRYFSKYFDTKDCTLKFFTLAGIDDAIRCHAGVAEYYYDKVFFPHVFLECLGLSIDYKLA